MPAPKTDRSFEILPGISMNLRARYASVNWDLMIVSRRPRQKKQARPQKRRTQLPASKPEAQ